jgi:hypothetical protein
MSINHLSKKGVAALVGGALAIASIAFVAWPGSASQAMHDIVAAMSCSHSTPCLSWRNTGTGTAIQGDSLKNNGVVGFTEFPSTSNQQFSAGVLGSDRSTTGSNNVGVFGISNIGTGVSGASTGLNGVQGVSKASLASGVYGENDGGGYGVAGRTTTNGIALFGDGGSNGGTALVVSGGNSADVIDAISCNNGCFNAMRLDPAGDLIISGLLFTSGPCSSGCIHRRVQSYAPHESVPSMEDFGEARMVEGRAFVALDAAFANVMDLSAPYLVFLTPEGDTRGLFVAERTRSGFVVKEIADGRSTLNFAYRIVAKPFGVNAQRLPMVSDLPRPRMRSRGGSGQ